MLNLRKSFIAALHDLFMASLSFPLVLYLRLGELFPSYTASYLLPAGFAFIIIFGLVAFFSHLHRSVWRFVSLTEMLTILRVSLISILIFYMLLFVVMRLENVPRSVLFLHLLLLPALLASSRVAYRALRGMQVSAPNKGYLRAIPVLLVGCSGNAEQFLRSCQNSSDSAYKVVALLDDDVQLKGRLVHGVKVYGRLSSLRAILLKLENKGNKPQRIILSENYLAPDMVNQALEICEEMGVLLARLPRLIDFQESNNHASLAPRAVNVEDLLGRPQNIHDNLGLQELIAGKRILITGAGGSIGSELCRQIARHNPASLCLLEISEYNLYQIDQELSEIYPDLARIPLIADVRQLENIDNIFADYRPELVFHAAALKHVPLSEINVEEALLTNVLGTQNIAKNCLKHKVEAMLLISTDKAVNPANVMGASKRMAEKICQNLASNQATTRFVTVRFGNVLGSAGSVVPLFQRQLAAGGPITVTHPEMIRYFMTIREAVELVLQAAVMAKTEKLRAPLFVLDMGIPVKIKDLAEKMIKLAGLKPEVDIEIKYTGLRPGEKLYEELFYKDEPLEKTSHASIMLAQSSAETFANLDDLWSACKARDAKTAREILHLLVPEFCG